MCLVAPIAYSAQTPWQNGQILFRATITVPAPPPRTSSGNMLPHSPPQMSTLQLGRRPICSCETCASRMTNATADPDRVRLINTENANRLCWSHPAARDRPTPKPGRLQTPAATTRKRRFPNSNRLQSCSLSPTNHSIDDRINQIQAQVYACEI